MRKNYIVTSTVKGNALTIKVTSNETAYYQINNGEWSGAYKTEEEARQNAMIKIYNL